MARHNPVRELMEHHPKAGGEGSRQQDPQKLWAADTSSTEEHSKCECCAKPGLGELQPFATGIHRPSAGCISKLHDKCHTPQANCSKP
jgi:hypothetical protein